MHCVISAQFLSHHAIILIDGGGEDDDDNDIQNPCELYDILVSRPTNGSSQHDVMSRLVIKVVLQCCVKVLPGRGRKVHRFG